MHFIHNPDRWIKSVILGLIIFALTLGYMMLRGYAFGLYISNRALAVAGLILINVSFVLSGTSYFWHIGTKALIYRKQLGVVGFYIALLHAIISFFFLRPVFIFPEMLFLTPLPFVVSLFAVLIFIMMIMVSNFGVPQKIGGVLWRKLLRVGYVGIILIMIHFFILTSSEWVAWLNRPATILPPFSLLLFVFSAFVLILRVFLYVALLKKPTPSPTPTKPAQPTPVSPPTQTSPVTQQ